MKKESTKSRFKQELRSLFKSMDFISKNFLSKEGIDKKDFRNYFNIYQQLGLAWEFLGLQCKHWDGYKKIRTAKEVCRICGKVKGIGELYYLIPQKGVKKIGKKLTPNSKEVFNNAQRAKILNDAIDFHGAKLNVVVTHCCPNQQFVILREGGESRHAISK